MAARTLNDMDTRDAQARPSGWRLATVGGVPVYVARSWPVFAVGLAVVFGSHVLASAPGLGWVAYAAAAAYAVLLLASVLVHEAAHAAMARGCGYRVDRVVVDLWGGHTAYESGRITPGRSALVAGVGPLANVALAALGRAVGTVVDDGVPGFLVVVFTLSNLALAGFNLLPGLPLDGGYLLDALVWKATRRRHVGLLVAGWAGRAVVAGLVGWSVLLPLVRGTPPSFLSIGLVALVGAVLWSGATQAVRAGRGARSLTRVELRDVLRPALAVPADTPVARLPPDPVGNRVVAVCSGDGTPVGVLRAPADAAGEPVGVPSETPASALCARQPPGWVLDVDPADPPTLSDVVARMVALPASVVVLARDGDVYGAVVADDVGGALAALTPSGP